jgi:hypothetical protein
LYVFFHLIFHHVFLSRVFEIESIAQQKAIETTKGDLRASQGGLYPPWSLMLSHILAGECFPFSFGPWMTKCEEGGLKKPHKFVSTKVAARSAKVRMYRN